MFEKIRKIHSRSSKCADLIRAADRGIVCIQTQPSRRAWDAHNIAPPLTHPPTLPRQPSEPRTGTHNLALPALNSLHSLSPKGTYLPPLSQNKPSPPILPGSTPSPLNLAFCCLLFPVATTSLTTLTKQGAAYLGSVLSANPATWAINSAVASPSKSTAAQPARPSWWGISTP